MTKNYILEQIKRIERIILEEQRLSNLGRVKMGVEKDYTMEIKIDLLRHKMFGYTTYLNKFKKNDLYNYLEGLVKIGFDYEILDSTFKY